LPHQVVWKLLSNAIKFTPRRGKLQVLLERAEQFQPDVSLSDIGMPGQAGYDFIREVRAKRNVKKLPAAALTAFARADERRHALLSGFQTHIAKPVDPAELVAVVASLAGRTGSA
jgi:CheY-like chemotaxis protein